MNLWVTVASVAAGLNVVLLAALTAVWAGNYRRHGAAHTLGLLVFGGFLLVENVAWVVLYTVVPEFYGWVAVTGAPLQASVAALCVLELCALVVLARVTLR